MGAIEESESCSALHEHDSCDHPYIGLALSLEIWLNRLAKKELFTEKITNQV